MSDNRSALRFILLGNTGTGKSFFIRDFLIKNTPLNKVLIYDIDDNDVFSDIPIIKAELIPALKNGVYRIVDRDTEKVFEYIEKYCKDTFIILEDAKKYIDNSLTGTALNLYIAAKQKNNDVLFTFHTFRDIPPKVFQFANFLILGKTNESISTLKSFEKKIPQYERVLSAQTIVLNHSDKYIKCIIKIQ